MRRLTVVTAAMAMIAMTLPVAAAPPEGGPPGEGPPGLGGVQNVIVQLADDHPNPGAFVRDLVRRHGGSQDRVFQHAMKGFSARLPEAAIQALLRSPSVRAVRPDRLFSIASTPLDIPTGYDRVEADLANRSSTNTDVDIAILDTGVTLYHPDLNVVQATDCTAGCSGSGDLADHHGHGTHVAGIAAAYDNGVGTTGVAPGARIWSVKVLDSSGLGFLSWIIGGVDIATAFAHEIDVVNMSLAGAFSEPLLDEAIANSVAAGITYVVAAGNDTQDAAGYSPASSPDVITVSAISDGDGAAGELGEFACRDDQTDDTFATFSNYGQVVDIAAPGVCIYSTFLNDGYQVLSGTSMAAPHVAGAAALYIAEHGRDQDSDGDTDADDVTAIKAALLAEATPQTGSCGFSGDPDAYPEPLLFLNGPAFGGDGTCTQAVADPTGPTAPSVSASSGGFDVDVTWSHSEDAESGVLSYVLQRDGSELAELDAHTTSYTDSDVAPSSTYSYTVIPKNRQGVLGDEGRDTATTSSADPSLVGWWQLDDGSGTVAIDSSGWGRHADLANGPVWSSGIHDGALTFDGSDDRMDLDAGILDGADDVTAAFWLRTTETGAQSLISGANPGNNNEYLIFLTNDTHLRFYVGTSANGAGEWTIPSLADGDWHHIAVVRNTGPEHIYLYLDGSYYGGYWVDPPMVPIDIDGLVIGQEQDSVLGGYDANQALNGDLDDVRLYSRVLSSQEIADIAAGPTPNSDPVANDDTATTAEDTPVSIDVLSNDTDADGDTLTVDSVTQPSQGVTVIEADGTITYTPNADFNGPDSFTYVVADGNGGSDSATVSVTVDPVNDSPTAADDAHVVTGGETLVVPAPGVLGNDSDVDGDPLTAVLGTPTSNGSLSLNADGSFEYTANEGFAGSDSFTYTASDGVASSSPATVTIDVSAPGNVPPVASFTSSCDDLTCDFGDTSTDSDGTINAWDWTFGDGNTSTEQHPSHTYAAEGDYTVTLTVTDDDGATDNTSAVVSVTESPPPPPSGPMLETGVVTASTDSWTTVTLEADYGDDLVVVTTPNYDDSTSPIVSRVRNASGSSFQIRLASPVESPASVTAPVHWVAVKAGVYTESEHGIALEAHKFTSSVTDRKGSWGAELRSYSQSYASPVVVGQVMTANDSDWSVFWARGGSRGQPPTSSTLRVGKHVGEDPDDTRADETIGYIVIEAGQGSVAGVSYSAGVGSDSVRGMDNSPPYGYSHGGPSSASVAVLSPAAMDGGDGGWPVLYGPVPVGSSELELAFDEDQLSNSERRHTTEQVAYIVFG